MPKVCIICHSEPDEGARKVKDDFVIKAIRFLKQKLGIAKNNELYVCEKCLQLYYEKRKKFERNLIFSVIIAALVFIAINGLQIFAGVFSIVAFFISIFLGAFIIILTILVYEVPPLEEK